MRVDSHIPMVWENKEDGEYVLITVDGLIGGHSGTEINKERGNAIKILGGVLGQLNKVVEIQIVDIFGGEKDNKC